MGTRSISLRHDGDTRLGPRLVDELSAVGVVLHGRQVPNTAGCIDHLAVAPSGIWVIDVRTETGLVEVRSSGRWTQRETRLVVDRHNRIALVHGLGCQLAAVHAAIERIGCGHLPIEPALCFTRAAWRSHHALATVCGVHIVSAATLVEQIRRPGPIDPQAIDLIAHELGSRLPTAP